MRTDMNRNEAYRFVGETWGAGLHLSVTARVVLPTSAGQVFVGGTVYPVFPGDLLLLLPEDICFVGEDDTFTAACWYFTESDLFGADAAVGALALAGVYAAAGQTEDVRAILGRALSRTDATGAQEILLSRMMLSELLLHLPDCVRTMQTGGKIALAVAYLTEHYTETVSLDDLCESIGLSKFYLCRAFRRDTGMTPHAYLNLYRVLLADRLLRAGTAAMACGEQVGYRDYTTFFRSYKKVTGCAPSAQPPKATV